MFNFFANESQKIGNRYLIANSDYNHIINVLRMKIGEEFLVSCGGQSDLCVIESAENETVTALITEENYKDTSLPIEIYLFQGLPKSDKLELIIQKTVELGVSGIIPVEMSRCIVKLDGKKKDSKVSRWQSISESAAKQSKRNVIPEIFGVLSYKEALKKASELDLILVPYESKNGMTDTAEALSMIKSGMKIGVFIGPEGGFDEKEIALAEEVGAKIVSLGKRILRTETAAITATAMLMLHAELNGDKI